MLQFAIITIAGWVLGLVDIIFYILSERGKLATKVSKIYSIFFGIALISLGVYILSNKEILRETFSREHYDIGGWIAISLGIVLLLLALLRQWLEKNETARPSSG